MGPAIATGTAVTLLAAVGTVGAIGAAGLSRAADTGASARARSDVPATMLRLYRRAAADCPGLPWGVLAAVGKVETDHGRARRQVSTAGAVGPMQFLPATFRSYAAPAPPGGAVPPTPWDRTDAVFAASRLLCANGGRGGADLRRAVFAYNHAGSYVRRVLRIADIYQAQVRPSVLPLRSPNGAGSAAGRRAVAWALRRRGKPYLWGAEGPAAYDCSGLVRQAWRHAGVSIPRVTYDQFRSGKPVRRADLRPGDLVFFHPGPDGPEHVGLYAGRRQMVEAPHAGATVRLASIDRPDYLGARRPG